MAQNYPNRRVLREISNIMPIPSASPALPNYVRVKVTLVPLPFQIHTDDQYVDIHPACELSALKIAYSELIEVPLRQLRFFYNWEAIDDYATPIQLRMRDGALIVVLVVPNGYSAELN